MITKEEVQTRLFHMASIFLVSALICVCGYIVVPQLTIPETDPLMDVLKFTVIMAFIVHIFGMMAMGVLLVGDTIERIQNNGSD